MRQIVGQEIFESGHELAEERHRVVLLEARAQAGDPAAGMAGEEVALGAPEGTRIGAVLRGLGLAEGQEVQEL